MPFARVYPSDAVGFATRAADSVGPPQFLEVGARAALDAEGFDEPLKPRIGRPTRTVGWRGGRMSVGRSGCGSCPRDLRNARVGDAHALD